MLGGPQAGIIIGKKEYIENPQSLTFNVNFGDLSVYRDKAKYKIFANPDAIIGIAKPLSGGNAYGRHSNGESYKKI